MADETQTPEATGGSSMSPMLIMAVVVLVVIGGGFLLFSKNSQNSTPPSTNQAQTNKTPTAAPNASPGPTSSSGESMSDNTQAVGKAKTFAVEGGNFSFKPNEIRVKKGDKVKITFTNKAGMHDFVIDELNVRTKTLQSGESETVEFTADKAGTFEFYCAIANHRAMGMKGNLIVE